MDPSEYTVKLEKIFEGPMDLLIHLIRKNEVDVYDIPVGLITEQYLAYLEWIKMLNIDNVGDFPADGLHPGPYQIQDAVADPRRRCR